MFESVEAVDKAMQLMFLIAGCGPLGVSELAKRSGMTRGRAYRLLVTLEENGLVGRMTEQGVYRLCRGALYLGAAVQGQIQVARVANSYLSVLGMRCNEDLAVRIRDGLESVCVARFDSAQVARKESHVGSTRPLHAGASGKLLLAHAPPAVRRQVLESRMSRHTRYTCTDPAALAQQLDRIRARGYSESNSEIVPGLTSLAVPVRDGQGQVVAALAATCPDLSDRAHRVNLLLAYLLDGASVLAGALQAAAQVDAAPRDGLQAQRFDRPSQ